MEKENQTPENRDNTLNKITTIKNELLYSNRFRVSFDNKLNISPLAIDSINLPRFNGTTGKWDKIQIRTKSETKPNTTKPIFELVENLVSGKIPSETSWFGFTIEELNASGDPINIWDIEVESVDYVDFGNLFTDAGTPGNYFSQTITLTITPFSVKLK